MKAKKIAAVLLAVVLSFSVLSVAASAQQTSIVSQVKLAVVLKMVDRANAQIEALIAKAQATKIDDTAILVATTNAIAQATIRAAAALGVNVVCVYVTYEVDGKLVVIDPLKVAY